MYLSKTIAPTLSTFISKEFPKEFKGGCKKGRYEVFLGIGGNIGDVKRRFAKLLVVLQKLPQVYLCKTSSILKNPPFGYRDQPFFFNAVIMIKTSLPPYRLLKLLQRIENRFGRKRSFKDAPRTLDLDILFFADKTMHTKELTLPHPNWHQRQSVLIPLMEVIG